MKRPADSWEGAIVRHRDTRKGRVLQDGIHRLTRARLLLVHWDDDTLEDISADRVTMLAPPLHYRQVVAPLSRSRAEILDRHASRWAILAGAIALGLLLLAGVLAWFGVL